MGFYWEKPLIFTPENILGRGEGSDSLCPTPPVKMEAKKNMKQQLEIKLEQTKPCRRTYPSHQRRARARWWFDQMRAVVEGAPEWKPLPLPDQTGVTRP